MSERAPAQTQHSAAPSLAAQSSQWKERPFTDERYAPVASAATISTDSSGQPKIAPKSFNLMNMPIFAPSPGANVQSGEIQRQEEEEKQEDLQLKAESNAVSVPEEDGEEPNQNLQLKAESDAVSVPEEDGEELNQNLQLKAESDAVSKAEAPQQDLQLKSIQTKLTVGKPGDKYEQEADSMAAKVMAMPDSAIQQSIQRTSEEEKEQVQRSLVANSITPLVQRQTAEDSQELQMKPGLQLAAKGGISQASGNIESHLSSSKGGGSPIPDDVRSFMEPRFGADFSSVRVHTDSTAVQMNKDLGAQAFAHGSDIYYGAGKSPGKNELTAHELTHTIQQGGAVRLNKEVRPKSQLEKEEKEAVQAKEIPNKTNQLSLNKELRLKVDRESATETLEAKQFPPQTSEITENKQQHLVSLPEKTEQKPLEAKQFTDINKDSDRKPTPDTPKSSENVGGNPVLQHGFTKKNLYLTENV